MSRRFRRFVPFALLAGIVLPILAVGCPIIVVKLCVINNTSWTMVALYLSPAASTSWGPSLLQASVAPGGNAKVTSIEPGTYDVQAVFDVKGVGNVPIQTQLTFGSKNICLTAINTGANVGWQLPATEYLKDEEL